jgi:hypothetical protein
MKPPWKFFTQLISRRESTTPGQAIEHDGGPKSIESKSQPAPAPEATSGAEQDDQSPSSVPVETTAANASDVDTAAPASVTVQAEEQKAEAVEEREPPRDKPSVKPRAKPSSLAGKGRTNRMAQSPVAARAEPVPQIPSVSENPFFDEAASLDEDIRQLKDQLAQKLRLQNAQLRKMLERFERS